MNNFKIKYLVIFLALGIVIFAGFSDTFPERPKTGFWAMEGKLITHYFEEKTDSLSGPELFELQNENGLPIWFGRHIFKDVCISGITLTSVDSSSLKTTGRCLPGNSATVSRRLQSAGRVDEWY